MDKVGGTASRGRLSNPLSDHCYLEVGLARCCVDDATRTRVHIWPKEEDRGMQPLARVDMARDMPFFKKGSFQKFGSSTIPKSSHILKTWIMPL